MAGPAKGAGPESFQDALGDIFMAIANAKLSPDADLGFLNKIEMVIMGRLKHSDQQPGGAQPPGQPGSPGGGAPQGPPPGGPPPGEAAPPQGGPAPHAAIPPPDMDDVRRTIAQTTGP
jgi:hypothetical protein